MVRVLVVDDSLTVQRLFHAVLGRDPEIEVVGTATDPFQARDLVLALRPDVVTLDLELPRMDGLTFLRQLMRHHPVPVVVVSSLSPQGGALAFEALAAGAVEVLRKPTADYGLLDFGPDLLAAVHAAAESRPAAASAAPYVRPSVSVGPTRRVVAIGASTGGTVAVEAILTRLPATFPGVLVTQHMPAGFTRSFAQRLDGLCQLTIREAEDGAELVPGLVLVAAGDQHLMLRREGTRFVAGVVAGPRVNRHRPSVDVTFRSVARIAGSEAAGVILTGMGRDGARGLLEMRTAGALTVAQDEQSSVVFGMPKAAVELDAASHVAPLSGIAPLLVQALGVAPARRALLAGR